MSVLELCSVLGEGSVVPDPHERRLQQTAGGARVTILSAPHGVPA